MTTRYFGASIARNEDRGNRRPANADGVSTVPDAHHYLLARSLMMQGQLHMLDHTTRVARNGAEVLVHVGVAPFSRLLGSENGRSMMIGY